MQMHVPQMGPMSPQMMLAGQILPQFVWGSSRDGVIYLYAPVGILSPPPSSSPMRSDVRSGVHVATSSGIKEVPSINIPKLDTKNTRSRMDWDKRDAPTKQNIEHVGKKVDNAKCVADDSDDDEELFIPKQYDVSDDEEEAQMNVVEDDVVVVVESPKKVVVLSYVVKCDVEMEEKTWEPPMKKVVVGAGSPKRNSKESGNVVVTGAGSPKHVKKSVPHAGTAGDTTTPLTSPKNGESPPTCCKGQPCKFYLEGACKSKKCPFSHPTHIRTIPTAAVPNAKCCKFFLDPTRGCRDGASCQLAHIEVVDPSHPEAKLLRR